MSGASDVGFTASSVGSGPVLCAAKELKRNTVVENIKF